MLIKRLSSIVTLSLADMDIVAGPVRISRHGDWETGPSIRLMLPAAKGVYQALSGPGGRLLPVASLHALLRQNVGLYNFFVFCEICNPVELPPSKRYVQ
jgi:hypothetical protein